MSSTRSNKCHARSSKSNSNREFDCIVCLKQSKLDPCVHFAVGPQTRRMDSSQSKPVFSLDDLYDAMSVLEGKIKQLEMKLFQLNDLSVDHFEFISTELKDPVFFGYDLFMDNPNSSII